MHDDDFQEMMMRLSKQLADDGKLIEAGWLSLRALAIPRDASAVQVTEMRNAFMAGAQHLFASIMSVMDPGDEPTDADLQRMDLIAAELDVFRKEVEERARRGGPLMG